MYDYEQIEDSLRFCDRKIYLSHIDDHNTKKYSESEKKKWEDIANDILKEKNTAGLLTSLINFLESFFSVTDFSSEQSSKKQNNDQ